MEVCLAAPAKINLSLHVGGLRPDGYHPVEGHCVFLDAGDTVADLGPSPAFYLTADGPFGDKVPLGPTNLIIRAAELMAARTGVAPRHLHLTKAVPPSSGIGGGTANGAAAMVLLNRIAPRPLSARALIDAAIGIGADGPVCVAAHVIASPCVHIAGIGERVSTGPVLPPLFLALANPGVAVPTGAVFRRFDAKGPLRPLATPRSTARPTLSETASWFAAARNDLTDAAKATCPSIAPTLLRMAGQGGCLGARMSGSGATVFGLFGDAQSAGRAAQSLKGQGAWSVAGPLWQPPR